MDDQAEAVGPSVDDRISAIIGRDLDRADNLEMPPPEELPGQESSQEPQEPQEQQQAEPEQEQPEEAPNWDEYKDVKFKVRLKNGETEEEKELALEELRLGYLRQDDYTRKTQEVAKTRAEIQQQAQQVISETAEKYSKELKAVSAAVDAIALAEFNGVDWNRLSQDNPAEFIRLSHRANQIRQIKAAVAQKLDAVEQQRLIELQQKRAQALPQAEAELRSRIPNWSDELRDSLVKTAIETYKRPQSELSEGDFDPNYVQMLHDAHQWRQLQAQKPIVDKKVAEAPKVLKPGTKNTINSDARRLQELRARIKKSGGKDKAAIEERIKLSLR